jgi:hypothetical protein
MADYMKRTQLIDVRTNRKKINVNSLKSTDDVAAAVANIGVISIGIW